MLSIYKDISTFKGVVEFLIHRKQYPFSKKRHFLNSVISFASFLYLKQKCKPCDALFILPSPDLMTRYVHITQALNKSGLKCEIVFFSTREIIKLSFIGAVFSSHKITKVFALEKGFALYLKERYNPKLIFQANDCDYLSPFLKKFSGAKLINIAHCVSCTSGRFDMFDFHYYFVFGESSIKNLERIHGSYGSCQLVKMGSLFLSLNNEHLSQDVPDKFIRHIVFSSQWLTPGLEQDIEWSRGIVNLLAERNPDWKITIKPHPLELDANWVVQLPNVIVDTNDNGYKTLLHYASFHITHHSAFALESSVCNVPTICIQRKTFKEECLSFKDHFPIVDNVVDLEQLIHNRDSYRYDIEGFNRRHLNNIGFEMRVFCETVQTILKNEPLAESHTLTGTYID